MSDIEEGFESDYRPAEGEYEEEYEDEDGGSNLVLVRLGKLGGLVGSCCRGFCCCRFRF